MTDRCQVCGCTDRRACMGGCCWIAKSLCSKCGIKHPFVNILIATARATNTPGHTTGKTVYEEDILVSKFSCEVCGKKAKIIIADIDEKSSKKLCSWQHLYKFMTNATQEIAVRNHGPGKN